MASVLKLTIFLPFAGWGSPAAARTDFALRDGDTVVFPGDSITAAGGCTKIVDHGTPMRYPQGAVRFFNAGQGGDTAAGAITRSFRGRSPA